MSATYEERLEADRIFASELERQFGKRAVEYRYRMDKSEYDERTMAAWREFRRANQPTDDEWYRHETGDHF